MKRVVLKSLLLILIMFSFCVGCNGNKTDDDLLNNNETNKEYLKSMVEISNTYTDSNKSYESYGSGILYENLSNGDAYIITNYHVIADCMDENGSLAQDSQIKLSFMGAEKDRYANGDVIGYIKDYDIAVLYAKGYVTQFPIVEAIDKNSISDAKMGEKIFAIGNALGKGTAITEGVVSLDSEYVTMNVSYQIEPITLRQIRVDASMNKGCSGGGLFNDKGKWLGLINARHSNEEVDDLGYAIPCDVFIPWVDKIIQSHKTGKLEIEYFYFGSTVKDGNANYFWNTEDDVLNISYDVIVESVEKGTIASVFLEKNDVIKEIRLNDGDWIKIEKGYYLKELFNVIQEGDKLSFKYNRSGEEKEYSFNVVGSYIKKIKTKE